MRHGMRQIRHDAAANLAVNLGHVAGQDAAAGATFGVV
jgi:hypothetical protein